MEIALLDLRLSDFDAGVVVAAVVVALMYLFCSNSLPPAVLDGFNQHY